MTEQYLILHKVRGEPQYDIAEKCMIGDEEGWVLCTCGHRAFPYWHKPVWELRLAGKDGGWEFLDNDVMPEDWPEHYASKPEPKINISSLINSIVKFKRRL
jgi:hypothetical protein